MARAKWRTDRCDEGIERRHAILRKILKKKTPRQRIEIYDYKNFGKGLLIYGSPQCSQRDCARFHQASAHPVLISCRSLIRVGVLGGGDFGLASELIRHKNITHISIIDWDPKFVEIARKRLREIHQDAWRDPRIMLLFKDAFKYLTVCDEKFHVAFGDLVDLPSWEKYLKGFGAYIKKVLFPNGKFVNQSGDGSEYPTPMKNFLGGLTEIAPYFDCIWVYKVTIPFFGYEQFFIIATDDREFNPLNLSREEIDELITEKFGHTLDQYSGAVHHSLFALSPFYKREIRAVLGDKFIQYHYI